MDAAIPMAEARGSRDEHVSVKYDLSAVFVNFANQKKRFAEKLRRVARLTRGGKG
jgi:hypothetical protein